MKWTNLTLASLLTFAGACSTPDKARVLPEIHSFESDGNGFNTKNFFYDNGEEVVVFDAQFTPEIAQKSLEFIRTKTQNPISYVVVTHPNPDKFNGASVFQKLGAKVVASEKTVKALAGVHEYKKYFFVQIAKMFTEETYPQLATVDISFDKSLDLRLDNGEVIRLQELSQAGVSSNQTVAFIDELKSVVVGDLIHHKAHAWLEGGIVNGKATPEIAAWKKSLKELLKLSVVGTKVLGGRGESADVKVAVDAQLNYLTKADEVVTRLAKKDNAIALIQAEMEKAFPDYTLSYMIQYGVYGLVDSKK
jgi:glyoxylase-like metal-dependent hydrolase (beta-lactamase superfamily II)